MHDAINLCCKDADLMLRESLNPNRALSILTRYLESLCSLPILLSARRRKLIYSKWDSEAENGSRLAYPRTRATF